MPSTATDRLQGLNTSVAVKAPCLAVSITALTLSGEQTVGGIACVTGDRVLYALSGGSVNNGIWVVDTGSWTRAKDFDGNRDVVYGTVVLVTGASPTSTRFWQVTTDADITIGTTAIEFNRLDPSTLWTGLGLMVTVDTRTEMKALDTTDVSACFLAEPGREGTFVWKYGNYTARVAADTLEGVYVKATAISAGTGAWIRQGSEITVEHFGADPTNTVESLPAFQAAYAHCAAHGNKTLKVKNGTYQLTGAWTIGGGVMVEGEGSAGSNGSYGTTLRHFGSTDCVVFDGNGVDFAGTGGGFKNFLLLQCTSAGGTALKIICTSDNDRPGEMVVENVLAYAEDNASSLWAHGLVVDGSACNTPGARGVRHLHMRKCRFAETSTAGQCMVLNQVTHFYAQGLATDVGNGVDGDVLIKGINDGINIHGFEFGGAVVIQANDATNATNNVNISGSLASSFTCNDDQTNGTADLVFSQSGGFVLLNKSSSLKFTSNINPSFLLRLAAPVTGQTGDGTNYSIAWDTEVYDQGNNVSAGVNSFTCYCAGTYQFDLGVMLDDVAVGHTRADLSLTQTGSSSLAYVNTFNPYAIQVGGNVTSALSCSMKLAYGDVVTAKIAVTGAAKDVDVFGAAGAIYSWLSGSYEL